MLKTDLAASGTAASIVAVLELVAFCTFVCTCVCSSAESCGSLCGFCFFLEGMPFSFSVLICETQKLYCCIAETHLVHKASFQTPNRVFFLLVCHHLL
uniref:Putative secreted protein n=1 Tax=Ixodes scapularis TaxID=6945 RepID=A0A4D5RZC4_IXOSC